jgi:ADP-ribose pyrophosphatase
MDHAELLLRAARFEVVRKVQTTPDGQTHAREIVCHPGSVVLLPLLEDGRVVLIRNYRVAIDDWLVELPAGTLTRGEEPLAAARRELAEETGYRARSLDLLCSFYPSPGILDERMHLFLATGLEPGPTELDSGEQIEPCPVAWPEALQMARDGRIRDAKTLTGLLYYEVFRARARTS